MSVQEFGSTPFVFPLGSSWTRVLSYVEADGVTPVNLSGYSAHMQVRAAPGDPVILDLDSTTPHGITINGTAGTITLALTDAQLTGLDLSALHGSAEYLTEFIDNPTPGQPAIALCGYGPLAVWDLKITAPGPGLVTRLIKGKCVFDPEVTE